MSCTKAPKVPVEFPYAMSQGTSPIKMSKGAKAALKPCLDRGCPKVGVLQCNKTKCLKLVCTAGKRAVTITKDTTAKCTEKTTLTGAQRAH